MIETDNRIISDANVLFKFQLFAFMPETGIRKIWYMPAQGVYKNVV